MLDSSCVRLTTFAVLTVVLAVGLGVTTVNADIVRFKTGQVKEGTITEETETTIKFKTEIGTVTVPKDMIISVERVGEAPQVDAERVGEKFSPTSPETPEPEPKAEQEVVQSRPMDTETTEVIAADVQEEQSGAMPAVEAETVSEEDRIAEAIADHRVVYGMTMEQVRQSVGEPQRVRRPLFGNKVWIYSLDHEPVESKVPRVTTLMFVYFEKDMVYYVSEVRQRK